MDKKQIREGYDQIAGQVGLSGAFYHSVIKAAGVIEGRVLDIGCGNGFLLENIRRQYPKTECVGCDFSLQLCKNAKEGDRQGNFVQGDAEVLPFASSVFDMIFITEVLEHLLEPEKALLEIKRILKPEGKLILTVPNRDWFRYQKYLRKRKVFQPVDDHWYTREELSRLLRESQFQIRSIGGHGSLYFSGRLLRLLEKGAMTLMPALNERRKRLIVSMVNLK